MQHRHESFHAQQHYSIFALELTQTKMTWQMFSIFPEFVEPSPWRVFVSEHVLVFVMFSFPQREKYLAEFARQNVLSWDFSFRTKRSLRKLRWYEKFLAADYPSNRHRVQYTLSLTWQNKSFDSKNTISSSQLISNKRVRTQFVRPQGLCRMTLFRILLGYFSWRFLNKMIEVYKNNAMPFLHPCVTYPTTSSRRSKVFREKIDI